MDCTTQTLILKCGADVGFEIVEEISENHLTIGSSFHEVKCTLSVIDNQICMHFSKPLNNRELLKKFPANDTLKTIFSLPNYNWDLLLEFLCQVQKYLVYNTENYLEQYKQKVAEVAAKGLSATSREALETERYGQELYRCQLLEYWNHSCAVTGCSVVEALRASHAKPWAECQTAEERLSCFNGFILTANLDALFDQGLITFDMDGRIIIAPIISTSEQLLLGLNPSMHLRWTEEEHQPFLEYHRKNIFKY